MSIEPILQPSVRVLAASCSRTVVVGIVGLLGAALVD